MESWSSQIIKTVDNQLESTREKEIRFYRIEEFKRNINRIDTFSKSCPICQNEKINISEVAEKMDEAINVPGESRREYDRLISRLSRHMQKEHKYYTPYHYTYLYSFFGIVAGLIIGFALMKLFKELYLEMLSIGFIIGLIPSYFLGFIKDKKIRREKRLM